MAGFGADEKDLLVSICDRAKCYRWMHENAYNLFWWIYTGFMVPIIVMSTVAGTGNFALARFSAEDQPYMQISIGVVSLTAGVLSTILQFLKITENLEGYRQAYLSWGKLARIVELELVKNHPESGKAFLDQVMSEFDRLMEISPTLPKRVIERFKVEIDHTDPLLIVPDICGTINHTTLQFTQPQQVSTREFAVNEFFAQHGRRPTQKEVSAILHTRANGD